MRGDTLTSPDGRLWAVKEIAQTKVLLERLDCRAREHRKVWKVRSKVMGWMGPDAHVARVAALEQALKVAEAALEQYAHPCLGHVLTNGPAKIALTAIREVTHA